MTIEHQKNTHQKLNKRYVEHVRRWADIILEVGKDRYGNEQSPLFTDGIHVKNLDPLTWKSQGENWILSNLASQQNWFRTLYGLTELTGDSRYAEAARKATAYALQNIRYGKLMAWGGHMAYNLIDKKIVHAADKGPQHELKCHYPFYELMLEIDPNETLAMIEAMWDSHISDWNNLEFNRHGQPRVQYAGYGSGKVWDRNYREDPVFFTGKGLTFINAGSDLYYAAAFIGSKMGLEAPIVWAERLAARYAETANPKTGMTGYQFSISVLPGQRGDRAIEQFGEQLADDRPIEATLSTPSQIQTIVGKAALCRMAIFDMLGERGRTFLDWAIADQLAYGRWAYEEAENEFHPILTNGRRLTNLVLEKDGYYGRQGKELKAMKANGFLFWAYASGYRRSNHSELWHIVRSMAVGLGLGDINEAGQCLYSDRINSINSSDPYILFGLLELAEIYPNGPFLTMAQRIGDNITADRWYHSFFIPSERHLYAKFDTIEPLALLHLDAAIRGERNRMPRYFGGSSFFSAAYDERGHTSDSYFYYSCVD
ncbi:hypothetical protein [Paenibacillus sp. FSL W7-1287]|uniref:hypothetical protein n=1 Tax=Paenibacillus sp. FSL W7-1287 TaxID=2954538 RepID=UPI0030F5AB33